jgi:hypothetical protein
MTDLTAKSVAILNETDRVILVGEEWPKEVIYDVTWSETDHLEEFNALFEIVPGDHQAGTDYYQGLDFMALIRRKSDGRLFGYPYWKPLAKHADEPDVEPNGGDHGFEPEFNADYTEYTFGPHWVFLPVEPFTITGYRVTATLKESA